MISDRLFFLPFLPGKVYFKEKLMFFFLLILKKFFYFLLHFYTTTIIISVTKWCKVEQNVLKSHERRGEDDRSIQTHYGREGTSFYPL